jgi:hypothetical protein
MAVVVVSFIFIFLLVFLFDTFMGFVRLLFVMDF